MTDVTRAPAENREGVSINHSLVTLLLDNLPTGAGRGGVRCGRVSFVLIGFGRGTVAGGVFVLCKSMHIRRGGGLVGAVWGLGGGAVEQSGHVAPGRQAE